MLMLVLVAARAYFVAGAYCFDAAVDLEGTVYGPTGMVYFWSYTLLTTFLLINVRSIIFVKSSSIIQS